MFIIIIVSTFKICFLSQTTFEQTLLGVYYCQHTQNLFPVSNYFQTHLIRCLLLLLLSAHSKFVSCLKLLSNIPYQVFIIVSTFKKFLLSQTTFKHTLLGGYYYYCQHSQNLFPVSNYFKTHLIRCLSLLLLSSQHIQKNYLKLLSCHIAMKQQLSNTASSMVCPVKLKTEGLIFWS